MPSPLAMSAKAAKRSSLGDRLRLRKGVDAQSIEFLNIDAPVRTVKEPGPHYSLGECGRRRMEPMSDTPQEHWDGVYAARAPDAVSWFQSEPAPSLRMIAAAGIGHDDAVIDIGGGASNLVDRLLARGYRQITVLDICVQALAVAKARLGRRSVSVDWLVTDITSWAPPVATFDLWHDRAVFHFLVEKADRQAYLRALNRALRPDGYVVLAAFAPTGPDRCSGLPVQRYSPELLAAVLGASFQLIAARTKTHLTPGGVSQDFVWCLFRKIVE